MGKNSYTFETKKEIEDFLFKYSDKTSEIVRQLAISGAALCWLFLFEFNSYNNKQWLIPLVLFSASLALDFFHYVTAVSKFRKPTPVAHGYQVTTSFNIL